MVLAVDKFNEFNPCQNGGIVGFFHEHGHRFRVRRQVDERLRPVVGK